VCSTITLGALTGSGTLRLVFTGALTFTGNVQVTNLILSTANTVTPTYGTWSAMTSVTFTGGGTFTSPASTNYGVGTSGAGILIIDGATVSTTTAAVPARLDVRNGGILSSSNNVNIAPNGNSPSCVNSAGAGTLRITSYVLLPPSLTTASRFLSVVAFADVVRLSLQRIGSDHL
jgi:hypothetical protein